MEDTIDILEVNPQIKQDKIWVRKKQPLILYILVIICQCYTTIEVYVTIQQFIYNSNWIRAFWIIVSTATARIIIFTINSCYMSNLRGIFYAYTMLDILGVLNLCCLAVFIGLELSFTITYQIVNQPLAIAGYVLISLVYILYLGNFRLTMATCIWGKPRVIIYKLKIYLSCLTLIAIGIAYSFDKPNNNDCLKCDISVLLDLGLCQPTCKLITDCCLDQDNFLKQAFAIVGQFYVIYLAASLAFTAELAASMGDRDGINDLQVHYTIGMTENQELALLRQNESSNRRLKEQSPSKNTINLINQQINDAPSKKNLKEQNPSKNIIDKMSQQSKLKEKRPSKNSIHPIKQ